MVYQENVQNLHEMRGDTTNAAAQITPNMAKNPLQVGVIWEFAKQQTVQI
jgi:hypothetical protein